MNFDLIDWKILTFKVGIFGELWPIILDDFEHHLWNFGALHFEFKIIYIEKLS